MAKVKFNLLLNIILSHKYRFVVLILDEMKIQEDLVDDRMGQKLHGFFNLGNINSELKVLEKQVRDIASPCSNIATHTYPNDPWNFHQN